MQTKDIRAEETLIVRTIDDIGRVGIPKDIRRELGLEEGDLMEILVDKETKSVVFRKCE